MCDPIVIELQRLASDGECPVDQLLRKALIVATKLGVEDFKKWIADEMNGYDDANKIPDYRQARTDLHLFNPVQGRLIPLYMDAEDEELLRTARLVEPIGNVVELTSSDSATFQIQMSTAARNFLLSGQGEFPMEPVMKLSRTHVTKILDAVRNVILEWSLRLEKQGILGEGMRFSSEEKNIAMNSQNIHIGSFQGVLGSVTDSTVAQTQQMTVASGDFQSLAKKLSEVGVGTDDLDALKEALKADPKASDPKSFGPKVSDWIGKMMSKASSGTWKVTLDTAAKLLPAAIAAYYGLKL